MTIHFNADEILALAEQIERNGAAFYTRAAEIAADEGTKNKLRELASWEGSHEELFSKLRASLPEHQKQPTAPDPEDDTLLYLSAMAARHVFNQSREVKDLFTGRESAVELLDMAIGFERDSIVFFQGLEAFITESLGKDKVHALIKEEMGHVAYLEREKQRLSQG